MEKILIIADMEGCIGLYDLKDYFLGCSLMREEITRVLTYLNTIGKYDITVVDSHDNGENVGELGKKYSNVQFVSHLWNMKDVGQYDYAILIGFHGMCGVDGIMAHTLRPEISALYVGDYQCGEVTLLIDWLAYYEVKTIFVSGDLSVQDEIQKYDCLFYATKSNEDLRKKESVDLEIRYSQLLTRLSEAMDRRKICKKIKHCSSEVKVKFRKGCLTELLPRTIFKVKNEMVFFDNTKQFIDELYAFCQYINAGQSWIKHTMVSIQITFAKCMRPEDIGQQSDEKLKRLLAKKVDKLSLGDYLYLQRKAEQFEKIYCHD